MTLADTNKLLIEQDIKRVKDGNVHDFLMASILRFPDYFWTTPASNGKHHHEDERKEGGLVLHVRRLCRLTQDFVRLYELNAWEHDVLIAACILHDSFARGVPPNTSNGSTPFHPLIPRQELPFNTFGDQYLPKNVYDEIMECVESHSGPWSVSPLLLSKKKLPTIFQTIDHVGSRPHIKIEL